MAAARGVSRRFLLRGGAGALAASALGSRPVHARPNWAGHDPFSLGVAAGEPSADGFVAWTRLAPDPLTPDPSAPGGLTDGDVALTYEIATDPGMRSVVQRGSALGEAAYAHSVHVEVRGLAPGRPYWYRFTSGEAQSRIGHAWTAPVPGSPVGRLRFGLAS